MNTHVNFEIAKLLKEKGFDKKVTPYYNVSVNVQLVESGIIGCVNNLPGWYPAPTIAEVVMWLYEKHGLWVYTYRIKPFVYDDVPYPEYVWVSKCDEKFINSDNGLAVNHYYSPTEAYEAAILYTLNNLI